MGSARGAGGGGRRRGGEEEEEAESCISIIPSSGAEVATCLWLGGEEVSDGIECRGRWWDRTTTGS